MVEWEKLPQSISDIAGFVFHSRDHKLMQCTSTHNIDCKKSFFYVFSGKNTAKTKEKEKEKEQKEKEKQKKENVEQRKIEHVKDLISKRGYCCL